MAAALKMSSRLSTKPTTAVMPRLALGHVGQRPQVGLDEGGLEEQVFRRVAGQRQLGEGHDVAAEALARSIQSTTSRALASMAPTVGLTWASPTRTRRMPVFYPLRPAFTVRCSPSRIRSPPATVNAVSGSRSHHTPSSAPTTGWMLMKIATRGVSTRSRHQFQTT